MLDDEKLVVREKTNIEAEASRANEEVEVVASIKERTDYTRTKESTIIKHMSEFDKVIKGILAKTGKIKPFSNSRTGTQGKKDKTTTKGTFGFDRAATTTT